MKKPIKPLTHPINLQITPRLLAAIEASAGRKVPPGARIMLVPPPPRENPLIQQFPKPNSCARVFSLDSLITLKTTTTGE